MRLVGARVKDPSIQTVGRQQPHAGLRAEAVRLVSNPLCERSGLPGPPAGEPFVTAGPTELVSGIYLEGGPLVLFSAPRCAHRMGVPEPGTITVAERGEGKVVATMAVGQGQLARIPLAPGRYTITGTPSDGGQTPPQDVVIVAGKTVRQDVIVPLP